jgi:hypothetical protein
MLEGLEDRLLLYATTGGCWAFPVRITYSFAPDGTSIGGVPSTWNRTMANDGITTATWQLQFQKAAAVWQAVANINMVQVSDSGAPFGTSGNQQGDSRFGDIRIGGTPLSSGLALTFLPPPYNGGTLAGDIVMNTSTAWHVNSDYDIETVAIHEIGHALGMSHSAISTAVMYANYTGMKQSLSTDDIQGIDSIYGAEPADPVNNSTYSTATSITSQLNGLGQATITGLNLTGSGDYDWYYVTAPSLTAGTMTVTMQSSGLSSLSPKVLVYNASLQGLAAASVPNSFGATVTTTILPVVAGQGFYIKAMAANAGTNGAYALQVNFSLAGLPPLSPPNTVVAQQPDQGGGSINLSVTTPQVVLHKGPQHANAHHSKTVTVVDKPDVNHLGTLQGVGDLLMASTHVGVTHPRPRIAAHSHSKAGR